MESIHPQRVFSLENFAAVPRTNKEYYALSHLWRKKVEGEVGWKTIDKQRDMSWNVVSTTRDMVLHLKDALQKTLPGEDCIWADSLCINQDDEDEMRTEVSESRSYYANSKACILCPWMGFGLSSEDHKEAGMHWCTRSWPVQEVLVAKQVILVYNAGYGGDVVWEKERINESVPIISQNARRVFGKRFSDKLYEILEHKKKGIMNIEESLRMAKSRTSRAPADLIYAYAGLSGVRQKLGKRSEPIIKVSEWLYHALDEQNRVRMLLVTSKPYRVAEGAGWMPNYCSESNELMWDCNLKTEQITSHVVKYEPGTGITLDNVAIVHAHIGTQSQKIQKYYAQDCTQEDNSGGTLYKASVESLTLDVLIRGHPKPILYKAVVLRNTNINEKNYYVSVLCYQPHDFNNRSFRKSNIMCIPNADQDFKLVESCIIG